MGRPYLFTVGSNGPLTIARIGQPGRFAISVRERYLGFLDGRVVTAATSPDGFEINVLDFPSGSATQSSVPVVAPADSGLQLAGSHVIVWSSIDAQGLDRGVQVASLNDGTVRQVLPPNQVRAGTNPFRTVAVSESGAEFATTICASGIDFVGDCQPTVIIDLSTGNTRTVDLGGRQVTSFGDNWMLVGDVSKDVLLDASGHQRWSTLPFGLGHSVWGRRVTGNGLLIADVGSLADAGHTLVSVNLQTGQQVVLIQYTYEKRSFWPQYSTDRMAALGYANNPPVCVDCDSDLPPVIDAATLDLSTRTLTEHAIQITLIP